MTAAGSQPYQAHYLSALNPSAGDLKSNLLSELRSYLSLTATDDELYETCRRATEEITREWRKRRIDPTDKAAVTTFYVDTQLYCYELIALEIDAPAHRQEQLASFAELLRKNDRRHGIDYGSGIGTLGIYLNRNGIRCDFADVSETNLRFIDQRLKRRGLSGNRLVNLMTETIPSDRYDFVTAFDVLEHVPDPLELIGEVAAKLRPGGLFVFNLLGGEEDSPHILRDPNLIRKNIRGFGMTKIGAIGEFKVYQKVRRPELINGLLRKADSVFWNFRERIR